AATQPLPVHVLVAGGSAYWDNRNGSNGYIARESVQGGVATLLATGQLNANQLAEDGVFLYWALSGTASGMQTVMDGAILRAPLDGRGQTMTLLGGLPPAGGGGVDSGFVYFSTDGTYTAGRYNHDGTIARAPLSGGLPTVLASGRNHPRFLAIDDVAIYWVDSGSVNTPGIDDGTVTRL